MMRYTLATLLLLGVGCSQQSGQQASAGDEILPEAQPAGSSIHPAEATGYIDSVDPEAFPPTPGDTISR